MKYCEQDIVRELVDRYHLAYIASTKSAVVVGCYTKDVRWLINSSLVQIDARSSVIDDPSEWGPIGDQEMMVGGERMVGIFDDGHAFE